ncbi:MAG: tripartite tricarboxylate transporter TctB family protein [Burkholderiales bacterium]
MALKIRSMKDFNAGLMFMAIGAAFALGANQYPMGTAVRMGPAYFPSYLGWGAVALGLFVFVESFLVDDEAPTRTAWRPLILVIGSVMLFAALINTGGLITATIVQIIVSALGGHEFKWKEAIISAGLMSLSVWLIFDKALGLPFKLFPWS